MQYEIFVFIQHGRMQKPIGTRVARVLTSLPYIMRWCVVMSALKTTIQLLLAVRSSSVSASWGMLTFSSLVQWIRSGVGTKQRKHGVNAAPHVHSQRSSPCSSSSNEFMDWIQNYDESRLMRILVLTWPLPIRASKSIEEKKKDDFITGTICDKKRIRVLYPYLMCP